MILKLEMDGVGMPMEVIRIERSFATQTFEHQVIRSQLLTAGNSETKEATSLASYSFLVSLTVTILRLVIHESVKWVGLSIPMSCLASPLR